MVPPFGGTRGVVEGLVAPRAASTRSPRGSKRAAPGTPLCVTREQANGSGEFAAGVAAGARTGLGNLVIAALFLVAMFCAPLAAAIPAYATAPALILVGALMCGAVARVRWNDFSDAFPAFLTLVATPLTFSMATGLSVGLLSFTFVKLGTGRQREISPLIWVLTVVFLLPYVFLSAE